jgi:hypothetical protein
MPAVSYHQSQAGASGRTRPALPSAIADHHTTRPGRANNLARTILVKWYHRVTCPAAAGKIRCPLRPESMTLDRSRPEILTPPQHPPACCTQQTITVPPEVAAKTL